ncbi:unnamed protein product, partial [Linum tenue]
MNRCFASVQHGRNGSRNWAKTSASSTCPMAVEIIFCPNCLVQQSSFTPHIWMRNGATARSSKMLRVMLGSQDLSTRSLSFTTHGERFNTQILASSLGITNSNRPCLACVTRICPLPTHGVFTPSLSSPGVIRAVENTLPSKVRAARNLVDWISSRENCTTWSSLIRAISGTCEITNGAGKLGE